MHSSERPFQHAPALLAVEPIFGIDLSAAPPFVTVVTEKLRQLYSGGAARVLAEAGE